MLTRWIRKLIWLPFALMCRRFPLWRFRCETTEPIDGIQCIRIDNLITKILSYLGGGYDYAVCFVIDGELMIDTGFPWARRRLKRWLEENDPEKKIQIVVNTHYHEDHTGNNDVLQEHSGAKLLAHQDAVSRIRYPERLRWYRSFLFGPPKLSAVEPIGETVQAGQFHFEVIETPGHCPGHICLWEPNRRWLFSGDLYISADLDSQLGDAHGPDWIISLEKAIELRPTAMFDAHGVFFSGESQVAEHLQRKLKFLKAIRSRIWEFAGPGQEIDQLTRKVFDKGYMVDWLSLGDGWMSLITGSDFSRANIVKSFLRDGEQTY